MMSRVPIYNPNISRRLSQAMDEIGMNERTVNIRRHTGLLRENMYTLTDKLGHHETKTYCFGSQTEGTTTLGLNSDTDLLFCNDYDFHVIQDWSEWQQGKPNLLMLNDETSPGYCRLQLLRPDTPEAHEILPHPNFFEYDDRGRVVLKNTFLHQLQSVKPERHGPAGFYKEANADIVHAYSCKTWPLDATPWIDRYCAKQPHNIDLARKSVQSGCFLVPTGHCLSQNERLEWRLSTSMAERIVMFNMNKTQNICYALLKMLIKTFIEPNFPNTISSYHCKTVLMYLAENSHNEFWQEDTLLLCVGVCLKGLQNCICTNNCPHYFIPGNNLVAGRLGLQTRQQLVVALEYIICNPYHAISMIKIDNLGEMLRDKCSYLQAPCNYVISAKTHDQIYNNFHNLIVCMLRSVSNMQSTIEFNVRNTILENKSNILSLLSEYRTGDKFKREAVLLMMPSLCTSMGCLLASECIKQGQSISNEALRYFSLGIYSDVTSGRLKLASALYCAGDLERTATALGDVEERYNSREIEPLCGCTSTECPKSASRVPMDILHSDNIISVRAHFAFGVSFTRGEEYCVPRALHDEMMFRCTEEELVLRDEYHDYWMDLAVVDSLPFLYYLQYMTFGGLDRQSDQQRALDKLIETIMCEPRLFHRETALNLLGQCMEQEHRFADAIFCYKKSLQQRSTHNVARGHLEKMQ